MRNLQPLSSPSLSPCVSLPWSSNHLWSMTSCLFRDESLSFTHPHPISHCRRGKMLLTTVPRTGAWFRSRLCLDHYDMLLAGLPSTGSLPVLPGTLQGPPPMSPSLESAPQPSRCSPWGAWGPGPHLTPLRMPCVTAWYRAASIKHLLIFSFSSSYKPEI